MNFCFDFIIDVESSLDTSLSLSANIFFPRALPTTEIVKNVEPVSTFLT